MARNLTGVTLFDVEFLKLGDSSKELRPEGSLGNQTFAFGLISIDVCCSGLLFWSFPAPNIRIGWEFSVRRQQWFSVHTGIGQE
jgi:hypothetical protein